jgi:hypothetical protein
LRDECRHFHAQKNQERGLPALELLVGLHDRQVKFNVAEARVEV